MRGETEEELLQNAETWNKEIENNKEHFKKLINTI
jgi:hypothetical protein